MVRDRAGSEPVVARTRRRGSSRTAGVAMLAGLGLGLSGLGLSGLGLCELGGPGLGPPTPLAGASTATAQQDSVAQARGDLLVLADMPAGWTTAKNPNTGNSTLGDTQLARCIGVSRTLVAENPPSVNSPQFQDTSGTLSVDDNVTVFPSARNAATEFAIGANPKTARCMTALATGPLKSKLFGKSPKGTSYGSPLVSPVDPSAFGSGVAGFSLSVPVLTHGITVNVTVTQLETVRGRLGHQVTFTSVGSPFSIALEQHIMSVAAGRL